MSKKRFTPEQIIGKLKEAEVALSAITAHFSRRLEGFVLQSISPLFDLSPICFSSR